MKIFLEEQDEIEIAPVDPSEDRGIVILPKGPIEPNRDRTDLEKAVIGIDHLTIGANLTSEVHDINRSVSRDYSNGKSIEDPLLQGQVLSVKHQIKDVAVAKLMDTLNLIEPRDIERTRDQISLISALGNLVEKTTPKEQSGTQVFHLHLHAPNQRRESDYEVIEA